MFAEDSLAVFNNTLHPQLEKLDSNMWFNVRQTKQAERVFTFDEWTFVVMLMTEQFFLQ